MRRLALSIFLLGSLAGCSMQPVVQFDNPNTYCARYMIYDMCAHDADGDRITDYFFLVMMNRCFWCATDLLRLAARCMSAFNDWETASRASQIRFGPRNPGLAIGCPTGENWIDHRIRKTYSSYLEVPN